MRKPSEETTPGVCSKPVPFSPRDLFNLNVSALRWTPQAFAHKVRDRWGRLPSLAIRAESLTSRLSPLTSDDSAGARTRLRKVRNHLSQMFVSVSRRKALSRQSKRLENRIKRTARRQCLRTRTHSLRTGVQGSRRTHATAHKLATGTDRGLLGTMNSMTVD